MPRVVCTAAKPSTDGRESLVRSRHTSRRLSWFALIALAMCFVQPALSALAGDVNCLNTPACTSTGQDDIADNTVNSLDILNGTIATIDLAAGAVTGGVAGVIADDTIGAADIAAGAVGNSELATDAVTTDKIARVLSVTLIWPAMPLLLPRSSTTP